MAIDVFISVGKTSTPQQEQFVEAIERYMRDNDLVPVSLGRNEWSSTQPLLAIKQRMRECSGTAIIAFERLYIENGKEKRGSDAEKPIRDAKLPTVWNQIEAAIAYVLKHPLLVIVESDLHNEGLLEGAYDWYVQRVSLTPTMLNEREFIGIFADWKRRVEDYHDAPSDSHEDVVDAENLTIGQIINALTPAQLWVLVATIVGSVSAVATAAYKLGTLVGSGP